MKRYALALFLFALFAASLANGQQPATAPFSVDDIIDYHRSDVPCKRLTALLSERGVAFPATPEAIRRLRSAGVCDAAIQTVTRVAPAPVSRTEIADIIQRANAHLDQGQYADALSELAKARKLDPKNMDIADLTRKTETGSRFEKSLSTNVRFPLEDINRLLTNLTAKRATTLITQRGILCVPSDEYIDQLSRANVDDRVIIALDRKGRENDRQLRKLIEAVNSGLDQGKYAEASEAIGTALALCPTNKENIAARDIARSAQKAEAALKPGPVELNEIERLLKGRVKPRRVATLVRENKLSFTAFTDADEKKLTDAGADGEVIWTVRMNLPRQLPQPGRVPPSPEAVRQVGSGKAAYRQKKYDEALKLAERAIAISPDYKDAWELKGDTQNQLKGQREAVASYDRALEIDKGDGYVWAKKGLVLQDLAEHKEAVQSFERSLEIDPTIAGIWAMKGNSLLALKRCNEAKISYDKAVELDPSLNVRLSEKYNQARNCGQ